VLDCRRREVGKMVEAAVGEDRSGGEGEGEGAGRIC
jgi:hypothetical protein